MADPARNFTLLRCSNRLLHFLLTLAMLIVGPFATGCPSMPPPTDYSTIIMGYGWDAAWICPDGCEEKSWSEALSSPFIWCWPIDTESGAPKQIDELTGSSISRTLVIQKDKLNRLSLEAPKERRDIAKEDVAGVLLAPMWYHAVNGRLSTESLADLMKVEGLVVIGSAVQALEQTYGPISYSRDASGRTVDVVFSFDGQPVRFRTGNDGEGGEPREVTGIDVGDSMAFWENLTPAAFPNSIGKITPPKLASKEQAAATKRRSIAEVFPVTDLADSVSTALHGATTVTEEDLQSIESLSVSLSAESATKDSLAALRNVSGLSSLQLSIYGEAQNATGVGTLPISFAFANELPQLTQLTVTTGLVPDFSDLAEGDNHIEELVLTMREGSPVIGDLKFLSPLSHLQILTLLNSNLMSVNGVGACPKMKSLTVKMETASDYTRLSASLTDLADLSNCLYMEELIVNRQNLQSLAGIEKCIRLQTVDFSHNCVREVSNLSAMTELKRLILLDNPIHDLSPMLTLHALEQLDIRETTVVPEDQERDWEELKLRVGDLLVDGLPLTQAERDLIKRRCSQ